MKAAIQLSLPVPRVQGAQGLQRPVYRELKASSVPQH